MIGKSEEKNKSINTKYAASSEEINLGKIKLMKILT